MLIKKITIAENEMDYTQFCHYCLEGYKLILSYILLEKSEKGYKFSKENYEYFINEYQEAQFKYYMNTQNLLDKYAPEYKNSLAHTVIFDFEKRTLNIYEGEADYAIK